jgi:hypothetical protein
MALWGRLSIVAVLSVHVLTSVPTSAQNASTARKFFVNAFDDAGAPVEDLSAEDLELKEGGKERDVVAVRPARGMMQIALIVDDNGTGLFRGALFRFVQRLQGRAEFAVITVIGQPLKLTDFTTDGQKLNEALGSLSARPGSPDGGQLLQGIYEAAKTLHKREAQRPMIVALTIPGEEHTTLPARHVLDTLRDSGAVLHVFTVGSAAARPMAAITKPSALLEENMNLGEVLGDGSKQSGGRREIIVAAAGGLPGLQRLADDLLHQYQVEYDLPPGVKPSDRVSLSTTRKGITLRAPTRIPAR